MRRYYHATTEEHAMSIIADEKINASIEGGVFVCDTPEDAATMAAIRGHKTIYVFKINVPDDAEVVETFDHNRRLFNFPCYMIEGDVTFDWIDEKDIAAYHITIP